MASISSLQGTHPSLKFSQNAKATVTAIIDGTGSLGAAGGPLVVGLISDHAVRERGCGKKSKMENWEIKISVPAL